MSILCKLCNQQIENTRLMGIHLRKSHELSSEEYYISHLNGSVGVCQLCKNLTAFKNINEGYMNCCGNKCAAILLGKDPLHRKKISDATKMAMKRPEVYKRYIESRKPITDAVRKILSEKQKLNFKNDPSLRQRIYTPERNRKISEFRKTYWKDNPDKKEHIKNLWKIVKERDETKWREHLKSASKKGFEKIFSPNGDTSLEIKLYSMLNNENIKYVKKYEIEHKIYDAFLPEHNTLIEIDGCFWHKKTLEECKYDFQRESYYNDIAKNNIAKKLGYNLIRIEENHIPLTILELIK